MNKATKYFLGLILMSLLSADLSGQIPEGADGLRAEVIGSCLIVHLGDVDKPATDLNEFCRNYQGKGTPVSYRSMMLPAIKGFVAADNAYRAGPLGAFGPKIHVQLVVAADTLPNAFTISSTESSLTILVTTALMDFVMRNTLSLANDMNDDEKQPHREGFRKWLETLGSAGGKSCDIPLRWNTTSLSQIRQQDFDNVLMISYAFIFAHEMAHVKKGSDCGYKASKAFLPEKNALELEKTCDSVAFAQLQNLDAAIPIFTMATFVAWQHYIVLKRPVLEKEFPGGKEKFKATFPALNFIDRARSLAELWERACPEGSISPMCAARKELIALGREIVSTPLPKECVP